MTNYDATPVSASVTINASSTAEVGDYTLNTSSLSFTADGVQNILLDINNDTDFDDEILILDIAVTSGTATINISQHTVSIIDNDIPNIIINEIYILSISLLLMFLEHF